MLSCCCCISSAKTHCNIWYCAVEALHFPSLVEMCAIVLLLHFIFQFSLQCMISPCCCFSSSEFHCNVWHYAVAAFHLAYVIAKYDTMLLLHIILQVLLQYLISDCCQHFIPQVWLQCMMQRCCCNSLSNSHCNKWYRASKSLQFMSTSWTGTRTLFVWQARVNNTYGKTRHCTSYTSTIGRLKLIGARTPLSLKPPSRVCSQTHTPIE